MMRSGLFMLLLVMWLPCSAEADFPSPGSGVIGRVGENNRGSQNDENNQISTRSSSQPAVLDPVEVAELGRFEYAAEFKGATSFQNYKEQLGDSVFYGMKTEYDTLSPKEQLLIDGWRGKWETVALESSDIISTLYRVMDFSRTYSRMPQNGAELGLMIIHGYGLTLDQFKLLTPSQQLDKVAHAINPITGRFFPSLTAAQWQPGAMSFTMLSSQEELLALLPAGNSYAPTGDFKEGWRVVVYGDRPGRVLMDRPYGVIFPPNNIEELSNPKP